MDDNGMLTTYQSTVVGFRNHPPYHELNMFGMSLYFKSLASISPIISWPMTNSTKLSFRHAESVHWSFRWKWDHITIYHLFSNIRLPFITLCIDHIVWNDLLSQYISPYINRSFHTSDRGIDVPTLARCASSPGRRIPEFWRKSRWFEENHPGDLEKIHRNSQFSSSYNHIDNHQASLTIIKHHQPSLTIINHH